MPTIALVVLAFNEEDSVASFVRECLEFLEECAEGSEIIVVDDGSSDGTADQVLAIDDSRVRLHRHGENRGMGAGMRSGFDLATADYVTILAADGQVSPFELRKLLPLLATADLVLSTYSRRPSERYRVLLSRGLRELMKLAIGTSFELEGIYLFPRTLAVDTIGLDKIGSNTFFFSFELISRAISLGKTTATVVIEPRRRLHGTSKVANPRRIVRVAKELIAFSRRLRREQ